MNKLKVESIIQRMIQLGIPVTSKRVQVTYENETASNIYCYRGNIPGDIHRYLDSDNNLHIVV